MDKLKLLRQKVDIAKLRDYFLSATHPEGRHKARVFLSALGIGLADSEWFRKELLAVGLREECQTVREIRLDYGCCSEDRWG
jgi:hypothetical protein